MHIQQGARGQGKECVGDTKQRQGDEHAAWDQPDVGDLF